MEEKVKNFSERVKVTCDLVGNAKKLGEKSGISAKTIGSYKEGALPRLDNLIQIADAAGVNIQWLATGEGPMKKEDQQKLSLADTRGKKITLEEFIAIFEKNFPYLKLIFEPKAEEEKKALAS